MIWLNVVRSAKSFFFLHFLCNVREPSIKIELIGAMRTELQAFEKKTYFFCFLVIKTVKMTAGRAEAVRLWNTLIFTSTWVFNLRKLVENKVGAEIFEKCRELTTFCIGDKISIDLSKIRNEFWVEIHRVGLLGPGKLKFSVSEKEIEVEFLDFG